MATSSTRHFTLPAKYTFAFINTTPTSISQSYTSGREVNGGRLHVSRKLQQQSLSLLSMTILKKLILGLYFQIM